MKKHDNIVKYFIVGVLSLATLILLVVNACTIISGFWNVSIGDGIEIFILIFVSFYLVERQNNVDRKKEKINDVISKIQIKILDPELIVVDSENSKKVTRIKLKSISNLLEIVKDDISNQKTIESIVSEMDSLSAIIMDHIDDEEYIEKSNSEIIRLVTNIDTKLEQIKFDIS